MHRHQSLVNRHDGNWGLRRGMFHRPKRLTYAFLDQYSAAESSPLASPRVDQPVGSSVLEQSNGAMAVASGKLALTGQATSVAPEKLYQRISGQTFARNAGQCWLIAADVRIQSFVSTGVYLGWWSGTTFNSGVELGVRTILLGLQKRGGGASATIDGLATDTNYSFAVLTKSSAEGGAFYLARGGHFGSNWQLLFHDFAGTTASLHGGMANERANATLDNLRVPRLSFVPGPSHNVASPSVGVQAPGNPPISNGVVQVRLTQAATLVAGDIAAVKYRIVDSENFWYAFTGVDDTEAGADLILGEANNGEFIDRIVAVGAYVGAASSRYITVRFSGTGSSASHALFSRATKSSPNTTAHGQYSQPGALPTDDATTIELYATGAQQFADLLTYKSYWPELDHV